jgi:RNA recognition motif-containing protein
MNPRGFSGMRATPSAADIADAKTLWIGDIESWMDEAYIGSLFAGSSVQNVKVIRDRNTGLPAGYGFVDFTNHDSAKHVLTQYNGKPIPGTNKSFRLNWGVYGGSGSTKVPSTQTATIPNQNLTSATLAARSLMSNPTGHDYSIYVGDIDSAVSDTNLLEFFQQRFKAAIGAKVIGDPITKLSKGYGFVKFSNFEDSQRAINDMQGVILKGKPIKTSQSFWKSSSSDMMLNTPNTMASYNPMASMYPYMNQGQLTTATTPFDPSTFTQATGYDPSQTAGLSSYGSLGQMSGMPTMASYGGYTYEQLAAAQAAATQAFPQQAYAQAYGGTDYSALYAGYANALGTTATIPTQGGYAGYGTATAYQQPLQQGYSGITGQDQTQQQAYGTFSINQYTTNTGTATSDYTKNLTHTASTQNLQPTLQIPDEPVTVASLQKGEAHLLAQNNGSTQRKETKEYPLSYGSMFSMNKLQGDYISRMRF